MDKYIVNPYVKYSYRSMVREATQLCGRYSGALSVGSIGKSYEERELLLLRLGSGRKNILLVGAHHGREYISSALLMRMCEDYALRLEEGDARVCGILRDISLWFVPMLNPDGVEISVFGQTALRWYNELLPVVGGDYATWKANARGVDLNRNYPCLFEKKKSTVLSPASEMYKGENPASEREVRALMALSLSRDFALAATFHAKGEEIYYADSNTPFLFGESRQIAQTLASLTGYSLAPVSEDPAVFAAGFENWFRAECRKPAILLELSPFDGVIPHDMRNFDSLVWDRTRDVGLLLAKYVQNVNDTRYIC